MKKLVILLLAFVVVVNLVSAKEKGNPEDKLTDTQSVLSGKVLDKISGEELTGVAVRLEGTDQICYTDFEGNFQFENLLPGEYELNVELISYNTVEDKKIKVGSNEVNELNINLEQEK